MGRVWWAWAGILAPSLALAQQGEAPAPAAAALPQVNIVGATPLIGTGIPIDKVPTATNVQTSADIARFGAPDALGALGRDVPGVSLDQTSGNPFQPDLLYRGFTASPLNGAEQGIAVYLNGARFNSSFGDIVNWDLIPDAAIDSLNLEGANPVYGLNALGGSLNVRLKNGFTYHGGELVVSGGSFGRIGSSFQYGAQSGNTSAYVAGDIIHEDGWRNQSSSDLRRIFGDIGWRGADSEAHISILGAQTTLNGPGTTPVELLDLDRAAQFTAPNQTKNQFLMLSGNVSHDLSDTLSLQGVVYYANFSQRVINGNTPNFQPCDSNNGFLCEQDGATPLTTRGGAAIPDYLAGGPYSQLNLNTVNTNSYGASLQVNETHDVLGHTNNLVAGLSFDGGISLFDANTLVGGLTSDRNFIGPGITIAQSDLSIAPVRVSTTNAYYGVFVSDVFDLTSRLALTASGRFNAAQIDLHDQDGTTLDGRHTVSRFNPGGGLTYKITPAISVYASYSEANRAPTPAEYSCASAASPCTLSNFFVADPALKQVVARTVEAGVRGAAVPLAGGMLSWQLDAYRTATSDDIIFVASPLVGRDYFQNAGRTRRQGVEAQVTMVRGPVTASLGYAYTDATFQSPLTLDSPLNPGADANGQIQVKPGDRLPAIPAQQVKLNVDYRVTPEWTLRANAIGSSGQVLVGDEANLTPHTPGYFLLNLQTSFQITPKVQLFAAVQNVTNAKYATYGTFSPVTAVPIAQVPNASNPRSLAPAAPVAGYGGVRFTF